MRINNIYVFGTFDLIQEINQFIKSKYSIFSYIDFDDKCFANSFDMTPLLKLSDIVPKKDDVVIISYSDKKNINAAIVLLLEHGFLKDNIIAFVDYFHMNYPSLVERFAKKRPGIIETLFFGMSHSQNGIFFSNMGSNVFPLVGPSLDLYLYKKHLEFLINNYYDSLSIKNIVVEMPYYFFNYDLSLQKQFVKSKMYYFLDINDYHNMDQQTINHFLLFDDLFDLKTLINKNVIEKNRDYLNKNRHFKMMRNIKKYFSESRKADGIWKNRYPKTIEENIKLFSDFLNLINKYFSDAKIKILIMPLSPRFRRRNRKVLMEAKKEFYSIVSKFDNIKIEDNFDKNIKNKYFLDYCHLYFDGKVELNLHSEELGE